jgi:hypothetical protein
LQPGGHRFDPGQLHQKTLWEAQVNRLIDSIFGLGGLLVPISAIIVGGVIAIVGMVHRHQERLAKIERGIHPDAP